MPVWLPWAVLVGAFFTLIGGYWDVWWHVMGLVETFFTLPHLVIYASVFLTGMIILVHVTATMLRQRRFAPYMIPYAPFLALTGTGSLIQLLSGVSDERYHALFGFDVTLWSPPHMLAVFGAILINIGAAGLFWAGFQGFARIIGYILSMGLAFNSLLFGLAEYDVLRAWSLDVRWEPYAGWYPLMVGVFGSFLFTAAFQQTGRRVSTWIALSALAYKLLVFAAWKATPVHMILPILFVIGALAFDMILGRSQHPVRFSRIWLAAMAFGVIAALLTAVQGQKAFTLFDWLTAFTGLAVLTPIAVWTGIKAGKYGSWENHKVPGIGKGIIVKGSGKSLLSFFLMLVAFFQLPTAALAHEGSHAKQAPDMHPAFVMLELAIVLFVGYSIAKWIATTGRSKSKNVIRHHNFRK